MLEKFRVAVQAVGFPLALEKVEGPAMLLMFLGILLDSKYACLQRIWLSLKAKVAEWLSRKKATKRQLLSLIGHLAHAAKVVTPGRTFVR